MMNEFIFRSQLIYELQGQTTTLMLSFQVCVRPYVYTVKFYHDTHVSSSQLLVRILDGGAYRHVNTL